LSGLSGQSIRKRGIFTPFHERTQAHGRSFGLSSAGYDVRLKKGMWLWPLWGRLGSTVEHFDVPNDLRACVHDKSTNARKFVFVQNTVIEPGWRGYLTLELTRGRPWPIYLKAGMPIAQVLFETLDEAVETPYSGKYQDQKSEAQPAILER